MEDGQKYKNKNDEAWVFSDKSNNYDHEEK